MAKKDLGESKGFSKGHQISVSSNSKLKAVLRKTVLRLKNMDVKFRGRTISQEATIHLGYLLLSKMSDQELEAALRLPIRRLERLAGLEKPDVEAEKSPPHPKVKRA